MSGLGKVICKVGEGWTCVITKTQGPDAGKVFVKCGENCSCTVAGEGASPEVVSGSGKETFCECGEGWSCAISKTEGPKAESGKGFAECAGDCSCVV